MPAYIFPLILYHLSVDRSVANVIEMGTRDTRYREPLAHRETGLPRPIVNEGRGVGPKGDKSLSSPKA